MPGWIGPWELAILLIIVLLVFGPKRLPEMGKSLGKGMREFKDGITGKYSDDDEKDKVAQQELPAPAPAPVVTAATAEEPVTVPAKHDTDS
jgi:sec-independent protein translocase protein TatA